MKKNNVIKLVIIILIISIIFLIKYTVILAKITNVKVTEEYDLANNLLSENTVETTPGTIVKLPNGWGTTEKEIKVSSLYAVAVGDGITVPVPYGFYYVGGNLSTGVIISDSKEDSYTKFNVDRSGYTYVISETTNHLVGNQFVFIPCTVADYKKTLWGMQSSNWETTIESSEITQIEKYGGFYVARYEAGLATTITEFTAAQQQTGSNQIYNKIGIPQSKAEQIPWDFIDWTTSKANAESMYDTEYVSSGLVTGTQWDIILNTLIIKSGLTNSNMINSGIFGNHSNDSLSFSGNYSVYTGGYQYIFGNTSVSGYNLYKTGESQNTMKYGIADVAGNLWEWTEEMSTCQTTGQYRVLRGGSFMHDSSSYPVCYRHGVISNYTDPSVGFRVVLYMK